MGDYGGPIAQDRMWREEISRDAIENSNGANGFLARGPYRAITRWHVLTIFQPLNSSPPPPTHTHTHTHTHTQKEKTYWCWGSLAALCLTPSITLVWTSLPHFLLFSLYLPLVILKVQKKKKKLRKKIKTKLKMETVVAVCQLWNFKT